MGRTKGHQAGIVSIERDPTVTGSPSIEGKGLAGPEEADIETTMIRASNDLLESGTSSVTGRGVADRLAKKLWDRYESAFHPTVRRTPPARRF